MRDLRELPKVELHIHLEGAMRIETVRELVDRNGVPTPSGLGPDGWRFDGPAHFIDQYIALCDLFTELDDFRRLGLEVTEDLAANGVRYAEAVFTPSAHAAAFGDDWTSPLEAMLDGLAAGARDHGTVVRVTPDVVRDVGLDAAERTLEAALTFIDDGVVGLNCAGSETSEIEPFAHVFRAAKDAGLRSVPHAGEWAGPENVWQTLEHFLPDRIGHGVRAIDDPRLVERLATDAIPLEVSPISNVATGAYPSLRGTPVPAAARRGRRGHPELRRPADVRRVAHRRLRDRPARLAPVRRGPRRPRPRGGPRVVRRRGHEGRHRARRRRVAHTP